MREVINMAKLKCEIELELKDKDGKVLEKRRFPSHTYVVPFFICLDAHLASRDMNLTKIDGTTGATYVGWYSAYTEFVVTAGYGVTTGGIVIGTSDTPYSPTQYRLQSIINHGSGVGQMLYGVQTIDQPQLITGGYRVVLSRVFNNVSGASITVKEIGVYMYAYNVGNFMMARDVIPPVTVGNGQSLTVRYIISLTSS
jgi:hypothetical protein